MASRKGIIVKGHCPLCGPDRNASEEGHYRTHWEDDDAPIWGDDIYRILKCMGCDSVYFQKSSLFSEDLDHSGPNGGDAWTVTHWPAASKRKEPDWSMKLANIDLTLYSLFDNIYTALNNDLGVLAAIGARTAFDRASELLKVDASKTFEQKLQCLLDLGKIGSDEKSALAILTDAGSAAAHRGWQPNEEQLATMMDIIENFLYRTFVIDPAAQKLKLKVPVRQKAKSTKP